MNSEYFPMNGILTPESLYPGIGRRWAALLAELRLRGRTGAVLAFSGGVDSSLLAYAAKAAGVQPLRLVSFYNPLIPQVQQAQAVSMAQELGLDLHREFLDPLVLPPVAANQKLRCYHCKRLLFFRLSQLAAGWNIEARLEGSNADDGQGFRPGLAAGEEMGILRPLATVELRKQEIRCLAQAFGLSCHDLPSSPCLASRFPYDEPLTPEALRRVELGEDYLRRLGFAQCRLRCQQGLARVEVPLPELPRLLSCRQPLTQALHQLGFSFVCLDLDGFRSGGYDSAGE